MASATTDVLANSSSLPVKMAQPSVRNAAIRVQGSNECQERHDGYVWGFFRRAHTVDELPPRVGRRRGIRAADGLADGGEGNRTGRNDAWLKRRHTPACR